MHIISSQDMATACKSLKKILHARISIRISYLLCRLSLCNPAGSVGEVRYEPLAYKACYLLPYKALT